MGKNYYTETIHRNSYTIQKKKYMEKDYIRKSEFWNLILTEKKWQQYFKSLIMKILSKNISNT